VLVTVSCDYAFKTAVRYSLDSYVLAEGSSTALSTWGYLCPERLRSWLISRSRSPLDHTK